MYHYVCRPNDSESDFGLENLQTVEEAFISLAGKRALRKSKQGESLTPRLTQEKLMEKCHWVANVAHESGQVGKNGIDIRVFWVPTPDGLDFGFAFYTAIIKNGRVVDELINVFSPVALDGMWLNVEQVARYD